MPKKTAAQQAFILVATIMGEMMEDAAPLALQAGSGRGSREAKVLWRAGRDIAVLAAAMLVLARRR